MDIIYSERILYGSKQQRFNQLLRSLKPISSRTLSLKLKKLELHGLLSRRVIPRNVFEVHYTITEKGKFLKKALDQMGLWYQKNYEKEIVLKKA